MALAEPGRQPLREGTSHLNGELQGGSGVGFCREDGCHESWFKKKTQDVVGSNISLWLERTSNNQQVFHTHFSIHSSPSTLMNRATSAPGSFGGIRVKG